MLRTRGDHIIKWIEDYCVYPSGPKRGKAVRVSPDQCIAVRQVYDNPSAFEKDLSGITGPLAAYLALMHICGPEALQHDFRPDVAPDIFTVWSSAGPILRAVLKRDGSHVVCPELGTKYPSAARMRKHYDPLS